jgi:2-polyprenyl-3-methyl-5-hydroxy-6-metoxy-1,4-benzoquinol methylase
VFGEGFARRMAKRYRRRGVDPAAGQMVDFLAQDDDLTGATILEIGGGVGEISVELLRRGAESATIAELSTSYDEEARRLAEESGVADRVHRRIVDVAASPEAVERADLVVLHRVVCCYPDYARLLGAAANRSRRRLAFSHPPRNVLSRAIVAIENSTFALTRKEFRAFVHPPQAMLEVLAARGLNPVFAHRGRMWHVEGLAR